MKYCSDIKIEEVVKNGEVCRDSMRGIENRIDGYSNTTVKI